MPSQSSLPPLPPLSDEPKLPDDLPRPVAPAVVSGAVPSVVDLNGVPGSNIAPGPTSTFDLSSVSNTRLSNMTNNNAVLDISDDGMLPSPTDHVSNIEKPVPLSGERLPAMQTEKLVIKGDVASSSGNAGNSSDTLEFAKSPKTDISDGSEKQLPIVPIMVGVVVVLVLVVAGLLFLTPGGQKMLGLGSAVSSTLSSLNTSSSSGLESDSVNDSLSQIESEETADPSTDFEDFDGELEFGL